ncbi:MAG: HEPN domain-containing protein [Desulfomonilaceae bacterium]|nr:HEPN domain-containing protein [Desulfomonilaceae bacterium]
MNDLESAHRWIVKAGNDFLNIRNNLSAAEVPWDTVCFHAQQSAEKLLKALLVLNGTTPPRTHDLVAVLAQCVEFEPSLRDLETDCRRLTYYAVGSRYPEDLYEPTEEDGLAMFEAAQRVHAVVMNTVLGRAASQHDVEGA